jgi:hypothetical protein
MFEIQNTRTTESEEPTERPKRLNGQSLKMSRRAGSLRKTVSDLAFAERRLEDALRFNADAERKERETTGVPWTNPDAIRAKRMSEATSARDRLGRRCSYFCARLLSDGIDRIVLDAKPLRALRLAWEKRRDNIVFQHCRLSSTSQEDRADIRSGGAKTSGAILLDDAGATAIALVADELVDKLNVSAAEAQWLPSLKSGATGVKVIINGDYYMGGRQMSDSHNINIGGHVINSQVAQTLTSSSNMIQRQACGEQKELLDQLRRKVEELIQCLPEDKMAEAPHVAENLEMLVQQVTSGKPSRKWYSVSSDGLLEASKWTKDFTGNIAGIVGQLGKLIWPDYSPTGGRQP